MTTTRVILALAALFIAALLAAWGVFVVTDRTRSLDSAQSELLVMAELLEEHAHRTLEAADLLLLRLKTEVEGRGLDLQRDDAASFAHLASIAATLPQVASLWVLGAEGEVLANSLSPTREGASLADREYFTALRDGAEEPFVGGLMDPRSRLPSFFSLSRPITAADGSFGGVVVAALHLDYFRRFYRDLHLPAGSTLLLLRQDGTLLLREPEVDGLPGARFPAGIDALTDARPQMVTTEPSPVDRLDRLVVRQLVAGFPVVVMASRPLDTILLHWQERLIYTGVLVAVLLLAVALLAPVGLRAVRTEDRLRQALDAANVGLERNVALRTAELEAALHDKNVLLSEVYHRVKNNLQLVEALLAMQSARLADPDAREAFAATRRRIHTLGLVHQQLLRGGDFATLDLRRFLTDLCDTIAIGFAAEERGIAVAVSADRVALDLDRAIPLGLLVNELVSNAFKHAFPEGEGGTVAVTASRRGSGGLILDVRDSGVGWAPAEDGGGGGGSGSDAVRSSGDRIIRALVAQLGASVRITRDHGTDVRIDIPGVEDDDGR